MADLETPGMVFPLEYQPLAWRDESGNTAIITFHVAIVAIPPNCHSKLPGWARLGKVNLGLMVARGNREHPDVGGTLESDSLLKQSHHHRNIRFNISPT